MRVLRIESDRTVTEHELDIDDWMTKDISWDTVDIGGGHDAWVDDEGMFSPTTTFCTVAGRRVTLPAYVAGADGERTVDARISVEELEALIG